MTTFDLGAAVLAMLDPILETRPDVLHGWAATLEDVARINEEHGVSPTMTARYRERAQELRLAAHVPLTVVPTDA